MAKEEEAKFSNGTFVQTSIIGSSPPAPKRKRNLPGTPDPEAEVIALSPKTLMATNRFLKHCEKKWKCEKCSRRYAVQSDWKAHSKTCGTREYKCDCGTLFSRRDSFLTHRAFCDALAQETARPISSTNEAVMDQTRRGLSLWLDHEAIGNNNLHEIDRQLGAMNSGKVYSTDPLVSGSYPLSSDINYQLAWMFGNKLSSNSPEKLTSTTLVSLPLSNVKENGRHH
ncbi:hypothetical protein SLA2020_111740 [Shorea laevis]